jgi:hypothetical protein
MDDDKIFSDDLADDVIPKKAPLLDEDVIDDSLEGDILEDEDVSEEDDDDDLM